MSLYVWGSNKLKQLNTLKELHCYTPGFIPSTCGDNVPTVVAAGENHTLILCESGDVYAFGRGSEGQLGNGNADVAAEANIVSGLNEETIVDIAAGSASSYAVTSTGNVYQWGVVYRKMRDVGSRNDGLHGLAQDQDNTIVEVDTATRLLEHNGDTEPVGHGPRQLRDIVQDSTEKWQLPTAEADFDYLNELRSIGYSPNEMKARMTERRKEHQDMILAGCTRGPQLIPSKIPNIEHIRVRAIAAGYSHVMLLTDEGRLYGAGYNDRGQLGLGHRINTSDFKPLDFLANKFVLEVACGYQHCICRAIDREQLQAMASAGENTDEVVVGSSFGADAYVWGNGTLGQLGLGLKGTTKGSLFPTRNVALHNQFPLGIVSISAGENFTAVVTTNGKVFSFGHSEYNQHGNRTGQGHDYVSAHYYFLPREVSIEKPANATSWKKRGTEQSVEASANAVVRIKRISCGAAFTVAIDDAGDLYSWGWNESGVLGHGIRHFGATPQRVDGVGATFDGCRLRSVSTGSKHVVALTEAQGHAWANSFHSILEAEKQVDCIIDIDDSLGGALTSKFVRNTKKYFPCHRPILYARSPYLRGYINTAVREMLSHAGDEEMPIVIHLTLPSVHANAITVKSLLDYLYLDRVQISAHKRPELARLAADLGIARLHTILSTEGHGGPTVVPSCFTENLAQLFNSPENADIVFVYPRTVGGGRDLKSSAGDGDCVQPFDETHFDCVIYAHRAVIGSRLPYFEALLSGGFSESHNNVIITAPYSGPRSRATQIDVSGLELEGIDRQVLEMVLLYAYTGQFRVPAQTPDGCANRSINNSNDEVDLNEIMSILVAANRLGFTTLLQHCERLLSLHLGDFFPHNARNCLDFATAYNIPRLERQCREILAKANQEIAEVETGPVKG